MSGIRFFYPALQCVYWIKLNPLFAYTIEVNHFYE